MTLDPRSPEWQEIYEAGESNNQADWDFALTEHAGWPDDVDVTPTAVAERMKALTDALRALVNEPPIKYPDGDPVCHWCGSLPGLTEQHEDWCPWVAARALLGRPQPEPEVVEHRRSS